MDFTVGLRDALLNLKLENENPCKFIIDLDNRPMLGPIARQITQVCLESYLQGCPDGKIRNGRTYNCVVRSNADAVHMLNLFVGDKLVTQADLEATHGIVVGKQAKTAVAKQAGSKAHLKKNGNTGRRRLLVDKDTPIKNLPLLKIFQESGVNAIITDGKGVKLEKTGTTGCKVEIAKVGDKIHPFKKDVLGCYHSETTGELTSLFELSKKFVDQATVSDDGEETLISKFEARHIEDPAIYVAEVYAQKGVGVRFTFEPKDQKHRRLLKTSGRNGIS